MSADPDLLLRGRKFDVIRKTKRGHDGEEHVREIVRHPGAVTIIPWLEPNRVCLIRNHRMAVDSTLIELPAGTLEADEEPRVTAARELIEETGYRAGELQEVCQFYMSPGILSERMHVFLATDLAAGEQALESGEEIETFTAKWAEALEMIRSGEIQDAKTIAAILFYDRFRERLASG